MTDQAGYRAEIRDFLATRRAKLTPAQVGLPGGGRRRVPGLRREEVAVLAGVSTEWYTRLERGHISGVSDDVLEAVARALQLTDEERIYLADLARAARSGHRTSTRRREAELDPSWQWMLDSMTMSAAFVRNGRLDMVASNPLARALHAPMFNSPTVDRHRRPNFARYFFLDPGSHHFFADWDGGADATTALLRAEAGRYPNDRALRELVGELSTLSPEFRTRWAAHDIRIRHDGVKVLQHPDVGQMELTYRSLDLPGSDRSAHDLTIYTAEPGSPSEDRLKLLASWAATPVPTPAPTNQPP
jgi:transcriptional regulator with XRE-family HTH domain